MLICGREELVIGRREDFRSHPAGFSPLSYESVHGCFVLFSFFFLFGKHEVLTFYLVVVTIVSPLPTFPSFVISFPVWGPACLLVLVSLGSCH